MTDHTLPVHEIYRGCEVYGLQSEERIAAAKSEIDLVISMNDPPALFDFAIDATRAPEARLLAKNKALASLQTRQRRPIDVERLVASTWGIERTCGRIGRLVAARHARYGGVPWPSAWTDWK
jgi:hypothetical protein